MDNEKSIVDILADLDISKDHLAELILYISASINMGYQNGFKTALSISTGLEETDENFIKLLNDLGGGNLDVSLIAAEFIKMVEECKKGEYSDYVQ